MEGFSIWEIENDNGTSDILKILFGDGIVGKKLGSEAIGKENTTGTPLSNDKVIVKGTEDGTERVKFKIVL